MDKARAGGRKVKSVDVLVTSKGTAKAMMVLQQSGGGGEVQGRGREEMEST